MLARLILVVVLSAGSGAHAQSACPSRADLNTADWKAERAEAAHLRNSRLNSRLARTCHKALRQGVALTPACSEAAKSLASSLAAWGEAMEDYRRLIVRMQDGDCQPPIYVPSP